MIAEGCTIDKIVPDGAMEIPRASAQVGIAKAGEGASSE